MHDLGFDSLLNIYLEVSTHAPFATALASFHLSADPFTARTNLFFDLDKMVYLKASNACHYLSYSIANGFGRSMNSDRSNALAFTANYLNTSCNRV
jgi:hypothetical protein